MEGAGVGDTVKGVEEEVESVTGIGAETENGMGMTGVVIRAG